MDDNDRLDMFLRRVAEVRSTRLVRTNALNASMHIAGEQGRPAIFSVSQPDEDDFRSLLMTFRHLVAPSEPATLNRIANLLMQRLSSDELRALVDGGRKAWLKLQKRGSMNVVIDGQEYGPQKALDLFLNGRYFHSDAAKAAELEAVGPMGAKLARQQLNELLVEGVNYALNLEWVIRTARNEGLLHT